ncbi:MULTISPECIES: hypothetical protein [unclassified Rhodococcus (in: high G+C Gram-positive bacteria)]|uniref:hypothetical protein n=1 Tax=unclassified Rhodococcus (in: high G+C Gram-positive bacteria) TaxID=192944 RepID=UPI00163A422B|nr:MULTISPECIES: hypothetical protein [unclassified Rhodococcus (in: high G+C Gram-positive bacteria)]MBC2644741.1 hypothetical protein [Rhodococcus sp. 3A]MBC2898336.1 hypothetical protein [Rhodococcus sp. 4CII]
MPLTLRLAGVAFLCAALAGCAPNEVSDSPQPTSPNTSTVASATTVEPPPPLPLQATLAPTPALETESVEAPVVEEPYILDCQIGLGPIETYWSDGTVTGYSDYCQSVHDEVLQNEVDANTPVCDGTVCRYPSGATIPDPNAVPDDRCTNQINYAGDPRSNAEINSIGAQTGQCPAPIS